MTIALRAAGAWTPGTSGFTVTLPAGATTGGIMLLFLGAKPYSGAVSNITGWTRITDAGGTNGTTASGVDTGSVIWACFYREWQSGDGNPTVQAVNTSAPALAVILYFSRTADSWETPT